jgi:hypothetical protein
MLENLENLDGGISGLNQSISASSMGGDMDKQDMAQFIKRQKAKTSELSKKVSASKE